MNKVHETEVSVVLHNNIITPFLEGKITVKQMKERMRELREAVEAIDE